MERGAFPVTDPSLAAKGRQAARALQRQITRVWSASAETGTHLSSDGMHAELEDVAIDVGLALIALRTVDKEVLQCAHDQRYLDAKKASDLGGVAHGLVLIRNSVVHSIANADPRPDRVISTFDGTEARFRVLPRWLQYEDLPAEVRLGSGSSIAVHDAYAKHVGGRC